MAGKQDKKQHNKSGRGFGKPFEKGKSGNPSGRPKGSVSITTMLRHRITEGNAQEIADNLLALALRVPEQRSFLKHGGEGEEYYYEAYDPQEVKLHQWAVDTILERLDGKVTQPLSNDPDNPVAFIINTNLPGMRNGKHKRD